VAEVEDQRDRTDMFDFGWMLARQKYEFVSKLQLVTYAQIGITLLIIGTISETDQPQFKTISCELNRGGFFLVVNGASIFNTQINASTTLLVIMPLF